MGGFFGAVGRGNVVDDVFFGTDYHSHLGTRRAGMSMFDHETGLQREIHSIENSPFRTKFENIGNEMQGFAGLGVISDYAPQPLLIRSNIGSYAIACIGVVNNEEELAAKHLACGGTHFDVMTGSRINTAELVAALIDSKDSFAEGIRYAQDCIEGTASILLLTDRGKLIAARDKWGRLPIVVGKKEDGYCVCFERFAFEKLGYEFEKELGPGEIVMITAEGICQLAPAGKDMRICAFLWSYYGYPTSTYEGVNVELMRYRNGKIMAKNDELLGKARDIDYVCGVPDSGTPHAIGYANESGRHFARAFIKYSPTWSRSFTPAVQSQRNQVAKMKQIPVPDLIRDKKIMFVDDSIVRGTQLRETVEFLYDSGAKEVHMRSACPPIMYSCKYLNFSRSNSDMELLARRKIMELEGEEGEKHIEEYSDFNTERGKKLREAICSELHLASLEFQSLDGIIEAIGLEPCRLCTYCWNGKG